MLSIAARSIFHEVCPVCLDFDLERYCENAAGYFIHDPIPIPDLEFSRHAGCKGCFLLLEAVGAYVTGEEPPLTIVMKRRPLGQFVCTLFREQAEINYTAADQQYIRGDEVLPVHRLACVEINKSLNGPQGQFPSAEYSRIWMLQSSCITSTNLIKMYSTRTLATDPAIC